MSNYIKGIFVTSFAAIVFGLNPLFVNFLYNSNINLLWTLFIRFFGSLIVFYLIIKFKKIKVRLDIGSREKLIIFFASLFFLLTSVFLVYSYTRIPSGLTTILHFSYPIIITLLSIKAKRDKCSIALVVSIIISISGVFLVTNPTNIKLDFYGLLSALLSALTFSFYLFLLNDEKVKKIDNYIFVFYLNFFAVILLLIISIILIDDFLYISKVKIDCFSLFGILGYIFASAFGASFFSYGTRIVGGPIASTIGAFEPLTAVLVGILYLNEICSKHYLIGVILIVSSVVLISLSNKKQLELSQ